MALQIVMFPWLAFGHFIPFLNLSNELAKRGHKISLLLPKNAQIRLQNLNLYPDLITFHKLTIPHVHGLPYGAETTADVPSSLESLLATSFDELYDQIKSFLQNLKPHFVFFDFAYWIPDLALEIGGIKTLCYKVICPAATSIALTRSPDKTTFLASTAADIVKPPPGIQWALGSGQQWALGSGPAVGSRQCSDRMMKIQSCIYVPCFASKSAIPFCSLKMWSIVGSPGYPSTTVVLHECEAKLLSFLFNEYGNGVSFYERSKKGVIGCDAIAIKTCREIEGTFGDYIATQFEKPVLYTGPVLPEPKKEPLEDDRLSNWLEKFEPGSVVFCAFGSQMILEKKQFQELVLGLELTELPFLVAVKPPEGTNSVEEALLEGFKERVQEKGLILDCWVPQLKILSHKSVGCFVSHCGYGSMWESLVLCDCQLVLLPRPMDHILNARLMEQELKVGIEVEKDENGCFLKESLCKAVKCVMDKDSQIGCFVKENHRKLKELLSSPGFMSNYIDNFIHNLYGLLVE
ncbi:hypothetical protein RND71_027598 [Anisodus tanguticus]|uniref:Glycosyltransferase n=1 Tax=Anisodus tanguticus TaxID=243964 RepID=A0AAE1RI90_9SOLA|nr:hypothetical protein RND71_027598 [Anisodus tanguticus]